MTTYYESAAGVTITRARAFREIASHVAECGSDLAAETLAFLEDLGDHETYEAQAVLEWLGY